MNSTSLNQIQMDSIFPRELSSLFSAIPELSQMTEIPVTTSSASNSLSTPSSGTTIPVIPVAINNRKQRKSNYSMEFKLQVLTWAKNTSFNAASRQFQVDRKVVKDWVESEQEIRKFIEEGQEYRKRLSGAGKKAQDEGLETYLVNWINAHGEDRHLLSRTMIQSEALKYSKNKDFKASKGWLDRFLRRNRNAIGRNLNESSQSSSSTLSTTNSTSQSSIAPVASSSTLEHFFKTTMVNSKLKQQSKNQLEASLQKYSQNPNNQLSSMTSSSSSLAAQQASRNLNCCVNCCEKLPLINDSLSRPSNIVKEIRTCITPSSNSFGLQIDAETEASRRLTLGQEITARVKVNHVVSSVYKLNFIDQLNFKVGSSCRRKFRDKNRVRNLQMSLCRRCGSTLTDLYKLYNDFNSFRKADSVLANLIHELDDCIHHLSQTFGADNTTNSKNGGCMKVTEDGSSGGIFMNKTIFEDIGDADDDEGDDNDNDDDPDDDSDLYEHGMLPFSMTMTTNPSSNVNVDVDMDESVNSEHASEPEPNASSECILPDHNLNNSDFESPDSADTFPSDEHEFKYDPDGASLLDLKVFSAHEGEQENDQQTGDEDVNGNNNEGEESEEEDETNADEDETRRGGKETFQLQQLSQPGSRKRKKYASRSLEFKLEVVEWAKVNSITGTSRKFNVPRKCIQAWKKNESLIRQIVSTSEGKTRQRLTGFLQKSVKSQNGQGNS